MCKDITYMPELPEVETTLRGILPFVKLHKIEGVTVRKQRLRWPIPRDINGLLTGQFILNIERRGKYLLFATPTGTLLLHLGMSGSLRILASNTPAEKHDHVDILFNNHKILRFTDPRRFGAILWTAQNPLLHPLLKNLGPEPLSKQFTADYLANRGAGRKLAIKSFIMDSKLVVGVGNIYASEALYLAKIHPKKSAGQLSLQQYVALVKAIKKILQAAIKQGGTTLRNFAHSEGKPGYFKVHLKVYGRGGLACMRCKTTLREIKLGQRSTVYCPACQK